MLIIEAVSARKLPAPLFWLFDEAEVELDAGLELVVEGEEPALELELPDELEPEPVEPPVVAAEPAAAALPLLLRQVASVPASTVAVPL